MSGKGQSATKDNAGPWRSRIVGHGESDPTQLLAHERNWRPHPRTQQVALAGVLDEVGWVAEVIVNKRSGEEWPEGQRGVETVVDGHLRVELAISRGEPTVPVRYVDLSPSDEALILATFDPISALAGSDRENLDAVLSLVETENEAVRELLAKIAEDAGTFECGAVDAPPLADGDRAPFQQMTFTVHDTQHETVKDALAKAKRDGLGSSDVNENSNGNALAAICAEYLCHG